MSGNFYSLLDCLDEEIEIEKEPKQTTLKEVIGHIVVEMALSRRNFIPILWEMQIPEELFYEVLWAYHRAKARLTDT